MSPFMIGFLPRRLVASALLLGSLAVPAAANAAPNEGEHGHALPPARSAHVNPHQLQTEPPVGDTPEQIHTAPRNYPVDQATYARLKSRADAEAAQRDRGGQ